MTSDSYSNTSATTHTYSNTDTYSNSLTHSHSTLKLEHISFSYNKNNILNDVNFSIDSSHPIVGLIGPNGCGKTTLFKIICNQLLHNGKCIFNDKIFEKCSIRELSSLISYIPQKTGIQISMSVLDVVLLGFNSKLGLLGHPNQQMKNAAINALNELGIEHLKDHDYLSLSEGEKQLCILARTIIEDTSVLLLDEPDSALDFHNKYCMMNKIKNITYNSEKIALICLHDPVLALDFCDQLILIKNGSVNSIIYPKTDSLSTIEQSFSQLYGNVTLTSITDSQNRRRLILMSDIN